MRGCQYKRNSGAMLRFKNKLHFTTKMKLLSLLPFFIFLMGCSNQNISTAQNSYIETSPLSETDLAHIHDEAFGYWFYVGPYGEGVYNETFNPEDMSTFEPFNGEHRLNSMNDKMEAMIGNISLDDREFLMSFLINYEAVEFCVLGEVSCGTTFTLTVEAAKQALIPFYFNADFEHDQGIFKLTTTLVVEPNRHVIEEEVELWSPFYIHSINYDLVVNDKKHVLFDSPFNLKPIDREKWSGLAPLLLIHAPVERVDQIEGLDYHIENHLLKQVTPGEEVTFYFIASPLSMDVTVIDEFGIPESERPHRFIARNYLIKSFLDWEPIYMNGDPFLFIEVDNNEYERISDLGRFTIIAPTEPGRYEFFSLLIPNANERKGDSLFRPFDTSFRFTIEVVE